MRFFYVYRCVSVAVSCSQVGNGVLPLGGVATHRSGVPDQAFISSLIPTAVCVYTYVASIYTHTGEGLAIFVYTA